MLFFAVYKIWLYVWQNQMLIIIFIAGNAAVLSVTFQWRVAQQCYLAMCNIKN